MAIARADEATSITLPFTASEWMVLRHAAQLRGEHDQEVARISKVLGDHAYQSYLRAQEFAAAVGVPPVGSPVQSVLGTYDIGDVEPQIRSREDVSPASSPRCHSQSLRVTGLRIQPLRPDRRNYQSKNLGPGHVVRPGPFALV